MDKERVEKKIENIAFSHLFCNVEDDDWPQDPMSVLVKAAEEEAAADEISDFCKGDDQMVVWQPFERFEAQAILDELDQLIEDMKNLVKEVATA